jgi:hypothetical protein
VTYKGEMPQPRRGERNAAPTDNSHQISKLPPFSNSPLHFFPALDINNSPRADVWQPVVFLNLSGRPGI